MSGRDAAAAGRVGAGAPNSATTLVTFDCDALLFDLDGVLVDSRAGVELTWRAWAERHGLDAGEVVGAAHGRRAVETVQRFTPRLDLGRELAWLVARESTDASGVREIPGARALLSALPPDRWAVVTSGVRAIAEFRLRLVTLPAPRVLVCADEIARGKPDPEGYLTAAHRLGVAPERCVVVEDAPAGIAAGRAAGMRVIGVQGTYDPGALHGADTIVGSVASLRVQAHGGGLRVEVAATEKNDAVAPISHLHV